MYEQGGCSARRSRQAAHGAPATDGEGPLGGSSSAVGGTEGVATRRGDARGEGHEGHTGGSSPTRKACDEETITQARREGR